VTRDSLTIVLADDHAVTRAGVRLALERGGFDVVAEAGAADETFEAVLRHRPSLCLLDLYMPGDSLGAARRIREHVPETKIVILTVSSTHHDFFEAIAAGASGYLLKSMAPDRLAAALRAVCRGEAALPRALERRLVDAFRARGEAAAAPRRRFYPRRRPPGIDLTAREWEVLDLIGEHLPTAVIARRLGISEVTVRRHISSAVHKLGVADRQGALELLSGVTETGWPDGSSG
jgi:DNA-binding NarL/FixJ family response regulator